jgi:cysteinyl-tRNA synthetase
MEEARKNVSYLNTIKRRLDLHGDVYGNLDLDVTPYRNGIEGAMNEDFNFRSVFRILMDLAGTVYREFPNLSHESVSSILSLFGWADIFLGVFSNTTNPEVIRRSVELLLDLRKRLREEKNYVLSDLIRSSMREMGIEVQDNGKDVEWWIRD